MALFKEECKAFVRRIKPYGRNLLCGADATTVIVGKPGSGNEVDLGCFCAKHVNRQRFNGPVEYRNASKVRRF